MEAKNSEKKDSESKKEVNTTDISTRKPPVLD
jgi:hypothetical protein